MNVAQMQQGLQYDADREAVMQHQNQEDGILQFYQKPTDDRFINVEEIRIKPSHVISDNLQTFHFSYMTPIEPMYLNLNNIQMEIKLELWKKDAITDPAWKPVVEADNVSVTPFAQDLIWENLTISLNGNPLIGTNNNYHHVTAHLLRILTLPRDAYRTYCQAEKVHFNDADESPDNGTSVAFKHRRDLYASKPDTPDVAPVVTSRGPILTDLNNTRYPMVGGVKFQLKATRCKSILSIVTRPPKDSLIAPKDWGKDVVFDLRIKDVTLLLQAYTVSEAPFVHHQKLLANNHVSYMYFDRISVTWLPLPSDVLSYQTPVLFSPQALPVKMFVLFFEEDRLLGSNTKSVFKYEKPLYLKRVYVQRNSQCIDPSLLEITNDEDFTEALFTNTMKTTQNFYGSVVPNLTYAAFTSHAYILAYDLTASGFVSQEKLPLIQTGNLSLKFSFESENKMRYNCLIVSLSPAYLSIDKQRQIDPAFRVIDPP